MNSALSAKNFCTNYSKALLQGPMVLICPSPINANGSLLCRVYLRTFKKGIQHKYCLTLLKLLIFKPDVLKTSCTSLREFTLSFSTH